MAQIVNNLPLYVLGNEYTNNTGDFSSSGYYYNNTYPISQGTKNTNNLYCKSNANADMRTLGVANAINTIGFTKMYWKGYENGNSSAIGLATSKNAMISAPRFFSNVGSSNIIRSANISSYQGTYYPFMFAWASQYIYTYGLWLTKEDDISGLSEYGNTIATILSNSSQLLADKQAIEYMVENCTGDFMSEAIANTTFINALANCQYKYLILNNVEWKKYLPLSYTYPISYIVGANINPINSGVVNGLGIYYEKDIVNLTAIANSDYGFENWLLKGYTQLEYIESTGTQYIDTLVKPKNTLKWILDCQYNILHSTTQMNGAYPSTDRRFDVSDYSSNGNFYINFGASQYNFGVGDTNRHTWVLDIKNLEASIDNTTKPITTQTIDNTNSLWIGARNASTKYYTYEKIYSSKIYDNNVLVRDFIPVIRHLDGAIGLLDLCEMKFYGNSGTDEFIGGNAL